MQPVSYQAQRTARHDSISSIHYRRPTIEASLITYSDSCVRGCRKVAGEKCRHPSSGAQCSDVITTLSRTYDSLDVLRREELLLRHRTHNGTHKSVRFLLVV